MKAYRVVFVDDEEDLLEIYETIFESDEVEVVCFSDTGEAVEFMNSNQIGSSPNSM